MVSLMNMREQNKLLGESMILREDIIACAMNISKRYNGSTRRADTLEHITTTIFDSMKKSPRHGPERAFVSAPGCDLA